MAGTPADLRGLRSGDEVVRASLLRDLCVPPRGATVTSRLLHIMGGAVEGELDLEYATVGRPLRFAGTTFRDDLIIEQCRLPALELDGCNLKKVMASEANLDFSLLLIGATVRGGVELGQAKIRGLLNCSRATITNSDGDAIEIDGAEIGAVRASELKAFGGISAVNVTVNGPFECVGAQIMKGSAEALSLDGARIRGGVFLSGGFKAFGEVRAVGGVFGPFVCDDACIENPGGDALSLDGAEFNGGVFLRERFYAAGTVRLNGATVKGPLRGDKGRIDRMGGEALVFDRATISFGVFLEGFIANGEVRAMGATIEAELTCRGATVQNPRGKALTLDGARIHARLDCSRAVLGARRGTALSLAQADVGQLILRDTSIEGGVDLRRASVVVLEDDLGAGSQRLGSWAGASPLSLDDFSYGRFGDGCDWTTEARHRWLKRTAAFQWAPWRQLADVYRGAGYEQEAVETSIAMHNDCLSRAKLPRLKWVGRWILRVTIGHGYRPAFAVPWAIGVISLYAILVSQEQSRFTPAQHVTGHPQPFVYAADRFLPVIDFGPAGDWSANGWMRWVEWSVILLGWILTTIFVAGFTRIVRTE